MKEPKAVSMTNLSRKSSASPDQRLVEAELRVLINRHGKIAVRDAATKLCKGKVGRRVEPDLPRLAPYIDADADAWLDGKKPEKLKKITRLQPTLPTNILARAMRPRIGVS
jgi:hypothetical protein